MSRLIALVPLQLGEQGVNPHSSEWPPDAHQDILGFDLLYQQQEGQWSIVGPVDHQLWSLCLKESSLMLADSCTIILQQHRIPFSSLLTNTLISYRGQQCPFAQTSSGFIPKPLRQASWPICKTVVATHRGWICHCLALHLWDQRRKRCRSKGSFQVHDKVASRVTRRQRCESGCTPCALSTWPRTCSPAVPAQGARHTHCVMTRACAVCWPGSPDQVKVTSSLALQQDAFLWHIVEPAVFGAGNVRLQAGPKPLRSHKHPAQTLPGICYWQGIVCPLFTRGC